MMRQKIELLCTREVDFVQDESVVWDKVQYFCVFERCFAIKLKILAILTKQI